MARYSVLFFLSLFSIFAFPQQDENLAKHFNLAETAVDSSLIIREFIKESKELKPEKAFELLSQSENLLKNQSGKKLWADYYLDAGEIYYKYLAIDKSTENYIKAYDYYQSTDSDKKQLIENQFVKIYTNTSHYDQAEMYLNRLYQHAVAKGDKEGKARAEADFGWLYYQMFMVKNDSAKLRPALEYARKAYKWIDKYGDDYTKMKLNVTMAETIAYTEYGDSAYYYYYQKVIEITDTSKTMSKKAKAFAYNQYARYLFDIGRPDLAAENAEKAFDIVKDLKAFEKLDIAKTLYMSYVENKDYKKATDFFEKYTELQDSLRKFEKLANINTLVYQQKNPRKASWIEKNWIGSLAVLLAVFAFIYFFIRFRQKRKFREAEIQLDHLTAKVATLSANIQQYEEEINELKNDSEQNQTQIEEKEIRLKEILESPLLTDDQWLTFKKAFEKVNRDFSKEVFQNFSNITQAELRYLYLKKLGLNHKEIASVLGISPDSVRLYKHRLGKKIQPGKEDILPVLFDNN